MSVVDYYPLKLQKYSIRFVIILLFLKYIVIIYTVIYKTFINKNNLLIVF